MPSGAGDIVRLVEYLPSMSKALGWTPQCSINLGIEVHTCNPNTQEMEAGGLVTEGHLWEFEVSLGYVRLVLKTNQNKMSSVGSVFLLCLLLCLKQTSFRLLY